MEKDEKIFKGTWWIPENINYKINGILTITDKKITLELDGILKYKNMPFIINGKTDNKENITLLECYTLKSSEISYGIEGKRFESLIECNYAFNGMHYDTKENIRFEELSVRYTNFASWTSIKRPEITNNESSINFNNTEPSTFEILLQDGNKIIINNYWVSDYYINIYTDKIILEKYSDVEFKFSNNLLFEECLQYIFHFRNFISISLHKAVGIISISFLKSIEDRIVNHIEIYCNFYESNDKKELIYHELLFTLKDIQENFSMYLINFYVKKDILNYIVNVYYGILKNKNHYITEEFLLYTRLLESYHRYSPKMESYDLPKVKFKTNKKTVLNIINQYEPSLKEWLCKAISRYANNKSFKDILQDIISTLSNILYGILQDESVEIFINKVRDTRNTLTHPKDINHEKENGYITFIYPMTGKLEILLLLLILKEIGFKDENIRNIFMNKTELQYYFKDNNWRLEPH